MKRIYCFLAIALFAVIVSCTDDDLDPLNFKKVTKGTLLALRGQFLDNIYNEGISGAYFVPLIADGTEEFSFDAEYLSGDPTSLESIDVYAEDADGNRTLLKNISGSEFKTTADYPLPWVTVSFTLDEILKAVGEDVSYPMGDENAGKLLAKYKAGIPIVTDLNLKDGSKVLADDLVAAGLYQSNQFYPAQRLPFDLLKYCRYADDWEHEYKGLEIYSDDTKGPNPVFLTWIDDNTYEVSGLLNNPANKTTLTFDVSTRPEDQNVTFETVTIGGKEFKPTSADAHGTYEQCDGKIVLGVTYGTTKFTYQFTKTKD